MWHHIQRHSFATRHMCVQFLVSLPVGTWALSNRDIGSNKCRVNSPLNALVNKNERILRIHILEHDKGDYRAITSGHFVISVCFHISLRCVTTCHVKPTVNNTTTYMYTYLDDATLASPFLNVHVHVLHVTKPFIVCATPRLFLIYVVSILLYIDMNSCCLFFPVANEGIVLVSRHKEPIMRPMLRVRVRTVLFKSWSPEESLFLGGDKNSGVCCIHHRRIATEY